MNPPVGRPGLWKDAPRIEKPINTCVRATWCDIGIVVWMQATLAAEIDGTSDMLEKLARHHELVGFIQVVEPECKSLESDARGALGRLLSNGSGYIRCSAVVFPATGFRAATVRAIATGLSVMSRHQFPHEVCQTVGHAAKLMSKHLPIGSAPDEYSARVLQVVEQVRSLGRHTTAARSHEAR